MSTSNWIKEQAGLEIERHPIDACFFEMCPKLSMQQRLYGYAGCVCLGMILNLGSWARLTELANGNPTPFVTLFTIGNIISLVGSFFLNGPYAQGKKMVGPEMRCATVTYLLAMILTFYVAYTTEITNDGERLGLVILLIVVQYLAMVWFIICSVTFLKRIVLACVRGTCTQWCPSCAKACSCMYEAMETAQTKTVETANKAAVASGVKKAPPPPKKGFFSFGTST